jgi:hypothetical protein
MDRWTESTRLSAMGFGSGLNGHVGTSSHVSGSGWRGIHLHANGSMGRRRSDLVRRRSKDTPRRYRIARDGWIL